jgi:F-type H+-transporting ATPase subunit alpha
MIFAGVKGFLDDVPMEKIGEFKENLLKEIDAGEKGILAKIRETRELNSDTETRLEEIIKKAKKNLS